MPWFRSTTGRLTHAVGGLAAVYASRGWEQLDDGDDAALVKEAQVRAQVEGQVSADVDARPPAPGTGGRSTTVDVPGVGPLNITVGGTPPTDPATEAEVAKTVAEEAPRPRRKKAPVKKTAAKRTTRKR